MGRILKTRLFVVLLFALAAAGGLKLLAGHEKAKQPAYETVALMRGAVERSISAAGRVKALVTVEVGSQLSGQIAEVNADFNQTVKAGTQLAVIDRAPFQSKVASAEASLAIARASVRQYRAQVDRSSSQVEQNERDLGRQEALVPKGGASQVQLEAAQTQLKLAQADMEIIRSQLEAAEATVIQRAAELEQAQIDLARTIVKSPIDGIVVDRRVQAGQTIAAIYSTPILFVIAQDLARIEVWAQVDEADIGGVHPGAPCTFTVDAFPDDVYVGTVSQVRLASTKTGGSITYTTIIQAQNNKQRLLPDMTATVRIITARQADTFSVANEALRFLPPGQSADLEAEGTSQATLWLADGASLKPQRVQLGLKGDTTTQIIGADVSEGQNVAVRLKDPIASGP